MQKYIQLIREALSGKEQDFTAGSVNRAIVLLSIPMVIEMFGEGLFAIVDIYFVGQLENATEAMNTVGLTELVATFVYSIAIGISIATTAMVARRIGEKDPEKAATAAVQGMILGAVLALLMGVLGVIFAPDILRFMQADEATVAIGTNYTRIFFASNIFILFLFILNGIFRGSGDATMAMYSLWIANGLNIILDPIFIFGLGPIPEMGVTGAAIATTIGRGVGVCFQLYILLRGTRIIRIAKEHLKVVPKMLLRLVDVATTGAGQFLIASLSWAYLGRTVSGEMGAEVFAGYIASVRVAVFMLLPAWGISNAAATLVGQNLGAKKPDRAETSVWRVAKVNLIFFVVVGAIFYIFASPIMQPFTQESGPIAHETAVTSLRILCLAFVVYSYGMAVSQAFGGAGDTRTPTIINFVCFWLIEMPLAYYLGVTLGWGVAGILWGIFIASFIYTIMAIAIFKQGSWKLKEI